MKNVKKTAALLTVLVTCFAGADKACAQASSIQQNVFNQSEISSTNSQTGSQARLSAATDPTAPGDPLPIDSNIYILFASAVAIAVAVAGKNSQKA